MNQLRGKHIFVGLSGGVDSAVSAALLQKAGAIITGVFIKGWYPEGLPCTWAEDRRDAMRVAAHLSIPFITLDASTAYKTSVLEYLVREYAEGRTPNPDVMCNRDVKFGVFYHYARSKGADFIATGHYAQTKLGHLYRGVDTDKDQSYFLWAVSPTVLESVVFPLGKMKKTEVRTLAASFSLPVAQKKDSQGICFLGPVSVDEFLSKELSVTRGEARDENGNVIGTHKSALLYTLGERVALTDAPPGPWFVLRKHLERNELIVSKERVVRNQSNTLKLSHCNWFQTPTNETLLAQYRYHGPRITGTVSVETNTFTTDAPFTEPIASGQSLVCYRGDECLGGGIIE